MIIRSVLLCVLCVLSLAAAPVTQPAGMLVIVTDSATGQPIPDSIVELMGLYADRPIPKPVNSSCPPLSTCGASTNAQGQTTVPVAQFRGDRVRLLISANNHVERSLQWQLMDSTARMPASITVKLDPARKVSGIIRSEDGKSVKGAQIYVMFHGSSESGFFSATNANSVSCRTGEDGRFEVDGVPTDLSGVTATVNHADFVQGVISSAALAQADAVTVLREGLTLRGRVLDPQGQPVEGAAVATQLQIATDSPFTTTGKDGTFEIKHERNNRAGVIVRKEGFAACIGSVGTESSDLRLEPLTTTTGRVVDDQGNPIADASIEYAYQTDFNLPPVSLGEATSRADGTFDIPTKPETLQVEVGHPNYLTSASNEKNTFVLLHKPHVTITAMDAETNQPIARFGVSATRSAASDGSPLTQGYDGKCEFEYSYAVGECVFMVESDGYASQVSKSFPINRDTCREPIEWQVKLSRRQERMLTIRSHDGKVVSDCDVAIATPSSLVFVTNGRLRQAQKRVDVRDGQFILPELSTPWKLVALAQEGYAIQSKDDLVGKSEITLQPWSTLQGRLWMNRALAGGQQVVLNRYEPDAYVPSGPPRISFNFATPTDESGSFRFDRLIPGSYAVGPSIKVRNSTITEQFSQVTIRPGESQNIEVGIGTREVRIKLRLPPDAPAGSQLRSPQIREAIDLPRPPNAKDWDNLSYLEQKKLSQIWLKAPENEAIRNAGQEAEALARYYFGELEKDEVVFHDMVPGKYILRAIIPRQRDESGRPSSFVAQFPVITVEPGPEPLDLGELQALPLQSK